MEEGHRAGWREVRHWVFGLALGAVVLAAILGEAWLALLVPVLFIVYAMPYVIAAYLTADREAEKGTFDGAMHEHERHQREPEDAAKR